MKKSVTIRVPATSANCGPGYDSLGLALGLYNDFTYIISDEHTGFRLDVKGEGADRLKPSGHNLAFASFLDVWNPATDGKRIGMHVKMHNRVPQSRGLGSSSTAIVAGVMAGSILSGANLDKNALLQHANRLEGHPDNVAPALFGGFTVSIQEDGKAYTSRMVPKLPLQFIAVVPDTPLSTHKARKAIPAHVPHVDAVFNSSRTALLVSALLSGDDTLLKFALEDKLHQNYRSHLIPGLEDVFKAAEEAGAYKGIISGAGSTLMAYAAPDQDGDAIGKAMVDAFAKAGQHAVYHVLDLDLKGARPLR